MGRTVKLFHEAKQSGTPLALVTAYDATMAALAMAAGVDALLVGDSLGMVIQGDDTTLSVSLDDMEYHSRLVVHGAPDIFVVADMPFMSYQVSPAQALVSAGRLMKESRVQGVKLEGGRVIIPQVETLVKAGIPVMGHLGLLPQKIHVYGGYAKQAKSATEQEELLADAQALQTAGSFSLVLENIPHGLAKEVTAALSIPTIGIGAGPHCDGQIQVLHDLFGLQPDFQPRHTRRYGNLGQAIIKGLTQYVQDVRAGKFLSQ